MVQWRLESPKKKQLTLEKPAADKQDKAPHLQGEETATAITRSQLEEFRAEGAAAARERKVTPVPPPVRTGWSLGRHKRGRGGAELEAIPEVASSHDI